MSAVAQYVLVYLFLGLLCSWVAQMIESRNENWMWEVAGLLLWPFVLILTPFLKR